MKYATDANFKKLIGAMGALIGAIFLYYGVTMDDFTTWEALFNIAKQTASNPAVIVAAIGAVGAYLAKQKRKGSE